MLVLCRKVGEKIQIGRDICITVVAVDRSQVRLGIEAGRDVPIWREELLPRPGTSCPEAPAAGSPSG
jgi:carbon storage regulator